MLAEKCVNNVIYVKRYNHCCLQLRFLVGTTILNVICCYVPQSVLSADTFYEMINSIRIHSMKVYLSKLHLYQRKRCQYLLVISNGHVDEHSARFEGVHGDSGYGMSNQDGLRIPDFSVANTLAITNTFFRKNKSRLITFSSGGNHAYIDFILVTRAQLKNIKDTKVPRSEECITQVTCL